MTWITQHWRALVLTAVAAVTLTVSIVLLDVRPRQADDEHHRSIAAGETFDFKGYRIGPITAATRDDEGLLPDGAVLLIVDIPLELAVAQEDATCVAVTLIETAGEHREILPLVDWEVSRMLGESPKTCVLIIDGEAVTETVPFVAPEDYDSLAVALGGPGGEIVEVALD